MIKLSEQAEDAEDQKVEYYKFNGAPVKLIWSDDGGYDLVGLHMGQWLKGWPGEEAFGEDAEKITKEEFEKMLG